MSEEKNNEDTCHRGFHGGRRKWGHGILATTAYLPGTVVDLRMSPGRTTERSMSLSTIFSLRSAMTAGDSSGSSEEETPMPFVSAGGRGAFAFGFLLEYKENPENKIPSKKLSTTI